MKRRKKHVISLITTFIMTLAMIFSTFTMPSNVVMAEDSSVVDPTTQASWENYAHDTTEYIGRIWTDKSVSNTNFDLQPAGITVNKDSESDFLVMLSALSTASNTYSRTSKPLDIVLVLDTSGSMGDNISASGYIRFNGLVGGAYNLSQDDNLYYLRDDGTYGEVDVERNGFIIYNYTFSTPDGGLPTENNYGLGGLGGIPDSYDGKLYYYATEMSKMDALKGAVNNFIDLTNEANTNINDDSDKHRISIVTYASGSDELVGLTVIDDQGTNDLKEEVDGLNANGATYADYGMSTAENVLNSARTDAQKVVIFFTDGEPNHQSGFDRDVANDTIEAAHNLKNDKTLIYSVGVFDGADPDADPEYTSDFNRYMHGVSNNYPNASGYGFRDLGQRANGTTGENSYYKAATDYESLNNVFSQIFDSINLGSGSPTLVEEGAQDTSGYITFTDTLGKYMYVTGFDSIVYGNTKYVAQNEPVTSGNITKYTFTENAPGNNIYHQASLSNIVIEVEKVSEDQEVVTVKIPASLIPLRYFDVTSDNGVINIEKTEAYPIRVFYNVALDENIAKKVENGTFNDTEYLNSNVADGKISFYSNNYAGGDYGTTIASFVPSNNNNFYYFTENTPLFTDMNGTEANSFVQGQTYYYQQTYYYIDEHGTAQQDVKYVKATNLTSSWVERGQDGQIYVRQGCRKNPSDYNSGNDIVNIEAEKETNATNTAKYSISPEWTNGTVDVRLGNNGRLQLDVPGSLKINKNVTLTDGFADAYNNGGFADDEFNFTVTFNGLTNTVYQVNKYAGGSASPTQTTISDDGDGVVEFTLKANESIEFLGLPEGTTYTVEEAENVNYTTQIDTNNGTITADNQSVVNVTNTFTASETTFGGSETLKVKKLFTGRDTSDTDAFTFTIKPIRAYEGLTMPSQNSVTITMGDHTYVEGTPIESDATSFGDITFTRPGTYVFRITEQTQPSIPGVSYSGDNYYVRIPVTVEKGETALQVGEITYYKNNSQTIYDYASEGAMEFTNTYSATEQSVTLGGSKHLDVKNSDKELAADEFTFKITSVKVNDTTYTSNDDLTANNVPMPVLDGQAVNFDTEFKNDENGTITLGEVKYDGSDVGRTYTYTIEEVNDGKTGYTYDPTPKEIVVTVSEDASASGVTIDVAVNGNDFTFNNTYEPETVTVGENTNNALTVSKTIDGRPWNNDSFEFTLTGDNNAPMPQDDKLTISAASGETAQTASFGDIEFVSAGEYTYHISETKGDKGGMTYDEHTSDVVVTIKDNNGKLEVESIVYDNDESLTAAEFVNTYEAEGTGNITIVKTIDGRDFMDSDSKEGNGGFVFAITADENNPEGATLPQSESTKTLTVGDKHVDESMNNVRQDTLDPENPIVFTKVGTYTFNVKEQVPADEDKIPGIEYDQDTETVIFTVTDNYDGTLNVVANNSDNNDNMGKVEFTNVYTPEGTSTDLDAVDELEVTKVFKGRDWADGESYKFTITPVGDAPASSQNVIEITKPESGNENSAKFGTITFDKEGTYKYTITENQDQKYAGVEYSQAEYELEIVVEDNPDLGRYEIKSSILTVVKEDLDSSESAGSVVYNTVFTNVYSATGSYELKVNKYFEGRDQWLDTDSFEFTLTPNGTETEEAIAKNEIVLENEELTIDSNTADKTATFGNITFNKEGDYSFVIAEEKPEIGYITYADDQTVDFKVTDENNDGTLTVKATVNGAEVANNTLKFVNTYTADATTAVITVSKTLDGKDWAEGDEFTFTLAADEKDNNTTAAVEKGYVVLPETKDLTIAYNDKDNYTASFGEITFKKEGTYQFTVTEGGLEGSWSNENSVQTVTITVNDDDEGHLVVVNAVEDLTKTFTNVFTPTPVSVNISGTKVMEGRELDADDVFEFTLTSIDNAPMPADATGATKVVENNDAVIDFGTINYDHADEYKYQITEEVIEDVGGVTSDPNPVDVIVTVTYDEKTGDLTPTVTYSRYNETNDGFLFTNTYEADPVTIESVVSTGLTGKKEITNADAENEFVLGAGDFSFTLTPADTNNEYDPLKDDVNVTNEADGSFTVIAKETEYTTVGEYVYYLSEDDTTIDGITKDTSEYTITVSITDEGHDGQLDAVVKVEKDGQIADAIVFDNTFDASKVSPAQIEATKTLNGKELTDGEFEFELSTSAENAYTVEGADASGKVVVKNTAAAESNVKFPAITFDKAGTYEYTITEVNSGKTGYVYDGSVYVMTYEVELDPDTNKLNVNGTLTKDGVVADAIVFENTYDPNDVVLSSDTDSAIKAHKTLDGRELTADEFTFGLYEVNGAEETLVEEVTNDANGDVVFSDLTFDTVGTYNYVIKENGAGTTNNGVTYHKDPISVTVTITDEGFDGQLDAEIVYKTESNTAEFTNTYSASAVTDLVLPVKKVLTNRELAEGEFTFELYQDGKLVETVKNDANGDVRFSGLKFDKAGETTYIVKEVKGNDKTITYDDTEYEIKVSVTDNQKGRLEAKVEVLNDKDDDGIATFENTYTDPEILVPDTAGDDDRLLIYLSLGAATACAIGIVIVIKKKEQLGK